MGGVLADLGNPVEQMDLEMSEDEFWQTWLQSPLLHALECGRIEADEFLARFPPELGLSDSPDAFRKRLARWHLPLRPGINAMLDHLAGRIEIGLLSNTNVFHWPMVREQSTSFQRFDHLFLSYEIGCCKPDPAVFEHVLEHVAARPGEILFLDDSAANVECAARFGIEARQVHGIADVSEALASVGVDAGLVQ